jgi:hypothetical protein
VGTSGAKAALLCDVCDHGKYLDREAEKQAKLLVNLNEAFNAGRITADVYAEDCKMIPLWRDYADEAASLPPHRRWDGERWMTSDERYVWDGERWRPAW